MKGRGIRGMGDKNSMDIIHENTMHYSIETQKRNK